MPKGNPAGYLPPVKKKRPRIRGRVLRNAMPERGDISDTAVEARHNREMMRRKRKPKSLEDV